MAAAALDVQRLCLLMRTLVVVRGRLAAVAMTAMLLGLATSASPAAGQAGWYYLPALTLTEQFDDNIFGTSTNRESDFITRLSSDLKVGYRSVPFTLLLTSGFDAEKFARNPDQDGFNRIQSGLETEWWATRTLTLRLGASFTETQTPAELVSTLGLELGRQKSTDLSVTPSLSYRIRRSTVLDGRYEYHRTEAGEITNTTHEPRVRLAEQVTRVDLVTAAYAFRVIDSGNASARSHLALVGWARRLSPRTSIVLEAGPRMSESGDVDAEVNATLSHRWSRLVEGWPGPLESSLTYTRSQIQIPTQTGASSAQALSGVVTAQPIRPLTLAVNATVSEVRTDQVDTYSAGLGLSVAYRLTRWLSLVGAYRFNHSRTDELEVSHSIVSVGLQARYPTRLDD